MRLSKKDLILIFVLNILFIYGYIFVSKFFRNDSLINLGIIIIIIAVLILVLFGFSVKEVKKNKKFNFNGIFYMILLLFPIALIGRLILPEFDIYFRDAYNLTNFSSYLIFMIFSLLPLLKEEILERVSQFKLSNVYGSKVAIIFISINFGLLHFIFGNFYYGLIVSVSVFFGSLILTSFFENTRNFLHLYLLHVIYDFIAVFQIFLHLNYLVYEYVFWVIYGVLFLIFLKPSWKMFKQGFNARKASKLELGDWVALIVFGILPILVYFLDKMFIS